MASADPSSPYGTVMGTALDVVIVTPSILCRRRCPRDDFSKQLPISNDTSFEKNVAQDDGVTASSDFYVTFPLSVWYETSKNANTLNSLDSSAAKIRRWTSFFFNDCDSTSTPTFDEEPQNARRASMKKVDSDHCIDYFMERNAPMNISTKLSQSVSPKRGNVQIQINGRHIPGFEMNFGINQSCEKACKFVDGNGFRPPIQALERLIGDRLEKNNSDTMERTGAQSERGETAILNYGRNLIRYILFGERGDVIATAEAFLYLWSACDSVIVSDIDGTITKSDVRGVIDTVVQEKFSHIHRGVCKFFNELVNLPGRNSGEVRFLYLSSRPITYIAQTRKLLVGLSQEYEELTSQENSVKSAKRFCLPPGPIMCHRGSLATVLHLELVAKNTYEFKADVLVRQIILPFVAAIGNSCRYRMGVPTSFDSNSDSIVVSRKCDGSEVTLRDDIDNRLFLGGFGNKISDAKAYELAGMERRDIYIINKDSFITCLGDEELGTSVSALSLENSECPIPELCCTGEKNSHIFRDESEHLDVNQGEAIETTLSEREQGQSSSKQSHTTVKIQFEKPRTHRKNSFRKAAKQSISAFSSSRSFASFPSFGSSGFYGYDDPTLFSAVKERILRDRNKF